MEKSVIFISSTKKFNTFENNVPAPYIRDDKCFKSLYLTDSAKVIFEPASSFIGDEEDCVKVIEILKKLCPETIPNYVN